MNHGQTELRDKGGYLIYGPISRWDTPLEISGGGDDADDNSLDDPDDLSIPIDSSKLLKKCVNPQTGTGN